MHPQSNGLVERYNRTALAYLRKYVTQSALWDRMLPALQSSYNNSPHSTTGYSPYFLLYGRQPRLPAALMAPSRPYYGEDEGEVLFNALAKAHQEVVLKQESAFQQQKKSFDQKAHLKEIKVNDIVYVTRPHTGIMFQKFQPGFMGPYRVLKLSEKNNVQLQNCKNFKIITVHVNRIKLAPFVTQHFELSDPNNDKRNDREKEVILTKAKRKEMIRELKEKEQLQKKYEGGTTPRDIVYDEDDEEPRGDEIENNDDVDNDDDEQRDVPAPLPQMNRPGPATRALMRIVGFKIPEQQLPRRPIEYKQYTQKKK